MAIFRYNETPGNYYAYLIEGHGDDANDGLTPETAVATLDALVTILDTYAGTSRRHAVIKKKRIYNEGITVTRTSTKPITFEFVGGCEIDGSGLAVLQFIVGDIIYNGDFKDYGTHITSYSTNQTANSDTIRYRFYNCSFVGCTYGIHYFTGTNYSYYHGACAFYGCYIIDSKLNQSPNSPRQLFWFIGSVCIGASTDSDEQLIAKNSIFQNNPNFIIRTNSVNIIDYCNIIGILDGKTHSQWQDLGYNLNGISANPQFTDPTNGQYTVTSASPCLYRGEGGEHIGVGEGFFLNSNMMWSFQAAISNFQLTLGRLGFVDPFDNAYLRTNPIDVGAIITLERAELAAILPVVAGDFTSGPVVNTAYYPAYSNTITYHYGAGITEAAIKYRCLQNDTLNQDPATETLYWERLTWWGVSHAAGKIVQYTDGKWYKAKQVTSTTWVAAEWDEVVMAHEWNIRVKVGRTYDEAEAAPFAIIPLNDNPFLDAAGLGNSDDDYDMTTAAPLVFRFVIIELHAKSLI